MPVGFKWFVDGLLDGSLGFGGEESAGASFLRRDGTVWTTDKDGIAPALLAAEITARTGRDPGELYRDLARELGDPAADRVDAPATPEQKKRLAQALAGSRCRSPSWPASRSTSVLDHAPGNGAPIGGIKVVAGQRLVRRAPVGHRGHLQDLRRELSAARSICRACWMRRSSSSMQR